MSLIAYRERVEKLARDRAGEPVFNGSTEHAAIIVEKMFAHARNSVHILTGNLNARVYGPTEVMEQARLFLADASHEVRILIEDDNQSNIQGHPFFDEFFNKPNYDNLEVRVVSPENRDKYEFHFLVMDGDSYRFEKDKTRHVAIAAFGDREGAENIETMFDSLWSVSSKLKRAELPAT